MWTAWSFENGKAPPRGGFPRRIFLEYKQRERRRTGIVAHRRRLFMPSFGYFDRKMRNNLVTYPCRTALTFARLADTIKKKWKRYYQVRNEAYLNRHYGKNFGVRYVRSIIGVVGYILPAVFSMPFSKAWQWKDLSVLWTAYKDGIHEKLGIRS